VVPAGSTLDLNGLHLYVRSAQVDGTIVGGSFFRLASGGPLDFAAPTSGTIQATGELDEWTVFGRSGQSVAVVVNTGSGGLPTPIQPPLNWAQVTLVDPSGNPLATASNSQSGADALLIGVPMPVDGVYTVQVQAGPGHTSSTGNYIVGVYD